MHNFQKEMEIDRLINEIREMSKLGLAVIGTDQARLVVLDEDEDNWSEIINAMLMADRTKMNSFLEVLMSAYMASRSGEDNLKVLRMAVDGYNKRDDGVLRIELKLDD